MLVKAWDKRDNESGVAYAAFLIYRDLGATRTLNGAYHFSLRVQGQPGPDRGQPESQEGADGSRTGPPPRVSGRWREWAEKFSWKERAEAYDRHFAAIRLQEAERVTRTFVEYSEAREALLVGLLRLQMNYMRGSTAESEKGKLIERVVRRVGRDAQGEPIQQEEKFSAAEQITLLLTLDKFLFGEVRAQEAAAGDEGGGRMDSWVGERLLQLAAGQETGLPEWVKRSISQCAPGLTINVVKDDGPDQPVPPTGKD